MLLFESNILTLKWVSKSLKHYRLFEALPLRCVVGHLSSTFCYLSHYTFIITQPQCSPHLDPLVLKDLFCVVKYSLFIFKHEYNNARVGVMCMSTRIYMVTQVWTVLSNSGGILWVTKQVMFFSLHTNAARAAERKNGGRE